MYSKSLEVQAAFQLDLIQILKSWSLIIDFKISQVINTSSSKKAFESDDIFFAIIQQIYKVVLDLFYILYKDLIQHFYCWKEETEVILKTLEKSDYSIFKVYKIVILLNCLEKVSEKIITIRLLYLTETTDLLDNY